MATLDREEAAGGAPAARKPQNPLDYSFCRKPSGFFVSRLLLFDSVTKSSFVLRETVCICIHI